MFNLNESNRFVMSRNPVDLRKGVDSLCGAIRSCHLDPLNGDVYVFSNRSRTVLKLLHWERGGYTLYSNHPKSAVFFDFQEVPTFVLKKVMFNLNESNRFVMSRNPVDLRKGVDSLCGAIRSCHLDPLNGDVYVFSNRSRTVLKLLHWERGGYTLYYKRLSMGRFHPKIFLRERYSCVRASVSVPCVGMSLSCSWKAFLRRHPGVNGYRPFLLPLRTAGVKKVLLPLKIPA